MDCYKRTSRKRPAEIDCSLSKNPLRVTNGYQKPDATMHTKYASSLNSIVTLLYFWLYMSGHRRIIDRVN